MVKNTFLTFIGKYRNQANSEPRQAAEHVENLIRFNNVVVGPLLAAVKVRLSQAWPPTPALES